jgi:tRNA nucleotidyltransferase/poly(A) polymerase
LRVRLSFGVEERTSIQYDNARAARVQDLIPPRALLEELRHIAAEPSPAEVLQVLENDGLLALFSPALGGSKLNLQALTRLEKAAHLVESANVDVPPQFGAFLLALTDKLTPKEKSGLLKAVEMPKAELDRIRNLEPRARNLEQALKSARVKKPSHVYRILAEAPVDEMIFLLGNSVQRVVQERIRNYLQKYLPIMQEVPPADWGALEGEPGTPKYIRNRQVFLASRLDVRQRKVSESEAEPATPVEALARGRLR